MICISESPHPHNLIIAYNHCGKFKVTTSERLKKVNISVICLENVQIISNTSNILATSVAMLRAVYV